MVFNFIHTDIVKAYSYRIGNNLNAIEIDFQLEKFLFTHFRHAVCFNNAVLTRFNSISAIDKRSDAVEV